MKLWTVSIVLGLIATLVRADNIQYAVVAFPKGNQGVGISAGGQTYPLQRGDHPNLWVGSAPAAETYQYVLMDGPTMVPEATQRRLSPGVTSTGNEFFNRSQTVFSVPELPQAYHPIYAPLMTDMNQSIEVATIILNTNAEAFQEILEDPIKEHKFTPVLDMVYINSKEVVKFNAAGLKNSGQSTKDFAKQSYKIELNQFALKDQEKQLLFGRTVVKLRAHETDPTLVREKLMMDMLAASGGATLAGSWVRLFINNEPFGLYLMVDDASTHFIDNVLHGGDYAYAFTGPTYRGNAMNVERQGTLKYVGDDAALYHDDIYKLEDGGVNKLLKNQSKTALIDFTKRLSMVDPLQATDSQHLGTLPQLLDPKHTMIHMAISFLAGSWDGMWYKASNYYLHQDLKDNIWTVISYDFDETFGSNAPEGLDRTTYLNFTPAGLDRPLIDTILKSPYYVTEFEKVLTTVVKRFFNPRVIEPRLEAWTAMLREDIAWDRALPGRSPGITTKWTVLDFETNMKTTSHYVYGIADWVRTRSASVCQQLKITDVDDLPPLGPYQHPQASGDKTQPNHPTEDGDMQQENHSSTTSLPWIALTLSVVGCLISSF